MKDGSVTLTCSIEAHEPCTKKMRGLLVDDGRWCTATWRPGRISMVSTRRRASREALREVMTQVGREGVWRKQPEGVLMSE